MGQRIKGQDVELSLTVGGVVQSFAGEAIRNFEVTPKFEKLEEQYLGQTSKKYDEIFHGVDFKFDMHIPTSAFLGFVEAIKNRAASRADARTSTGTVNIRATLHFAGGQRIVTLSDCYFEDMPLNFGGRSEYGQFTLSGSCSDIALV